MTTSMQIETNERPDITKDSTRGLLVTDVQPPTDTVSMPSSTIPMALNDTTQHDIRSILQRPVKLGTFEWSSTSPVIGLHQSPADYDAETANYLGKWNFPQDILNNSENIMEKLNYFQYLKADVEIEIKFNAQPFLRGALMLTYNPYYDNVTKFRRQGTQFLASQSSCPRKIISIEEGNSVKLICPYANIYDYFDLSNTNNQFGTAFLYALSPLTSAEAAPTVQYTVFARFINPDFKVPTSRKSEMNLTRALKTIRDRGLSAVQVVNGRWTRYAEGDTRPMASQDTGETTTTGPVATTAKRIATIASALGPVPIIGNIASSVGWVARAVSGVATVFGWSKSASILQQEKRVVKPNVSLIHTEGTDDSTTLALLQDNGIDGSTMIPEDGDEMALDYILARPNIFHSVSLSTSDFNGNKKLTAWEVSPFSKFQYGQVDSPETLFLGSFAYASIFASTLWRGTINFDIFVVKTPFHVGKFVVAFFPETLPEDTPDTLEQVISNDYNAICDLKGTPETPGSTNYRISVSFMSNTPWRETYKRDSDGAPNANTLDTMTGSIALYSMNKLDAPESVAQSIDMFVSHSAGEDYQLARPTLNLAPGYQARYAQADTGAYSAPPDDNLLVPQHKTTDVTAQTTGEYFKSLRSLIKRFNLFGLLNQTSNWVGLRTRRFEENETSGVRVMNRKNFTDDRVLPTSWYMASFLYRFYNGSSRLKIIPYTAGVIAEAYPSFDENLESQLEFPFSDSFGQPVFEQHQHSSNAFEVTTPFYRAIRCDVVGSNQPAILGDVRTNLRCTNRANFGGTDQSSDMFEAAGDDFSFFFLIGPPPMMDIKNVDTVTSFPTGNTLDVNLAGVATAAVNETTKHVNAYPVVYDPDIQPPVNGSYPIASSTLDTILIKYAEEPDEVVPVTNCLVYAETTGLRSILIPYSSTTDIPDPIKMTNYLPTVPPFKVVTTAPIV